MNLSASALAKGMGAAFVGTLKDRAPGIKAFVESESKKLAQTFVMIEKLRLSGQIGPREAKLQLDIQKNATRAVLLTIEGLGILAVEQAINAALDAVKGAVNTALDFKLL
jgi:hypothetical protein